MFTFLLGLITVMTQISVACCQAGVVTRRWDAALNVCRIEEGYSGNATEKQKQATNKMVSFCLKTATRRD